jgi:hypothetical protein
MLRSEHCLETWEKAKSISIKKEDILLVSSFNLLIDKGVIYSKNVSEYAM